MRKAEWMEIFFVVHMQEVFGTMHSDYQHQARTSDTLGEIFVDTAVLLEEKPLQQSNYAGQILFD